MGTVFESPTDGGLLVQVQNVVRIALPDDEFAVPLAHFLSDEKKKRIAGLVDFVEQGYAASPSLPTIVRDEIDQVRRNLGGLA